MVTGLCSLTPYYEWRHNHAIHHATSGDLDNRGVGDIWMLTVKEYLERPLWKRFVYRFYRNPLVMFGIGPLFMFFVSHRFISRSSGPREKKCLLDEPHSCRSRHGNELHYRIRFVRPCFFAFNDLAGRNFWLMAFLCPASVSGSLLGTSHGVGFLWRLPSKEVRSTSFRKFFNGSAATSGFIISII